MQYFSSSFDKTKNNLKNKNKLKIKFNQNPNLQNSQQKWWVNWSLAMCNAILLWWPFKKEIDVHVLVVVATE